MSDHASSPASSHHALLSKRNELAQRARGWIEELLESIEERRGLDVIDIRNSGDFVTAITGKAIAHIDCGRLFASAYRAGVTLEAPPSLPATPPVVIRWLENAQRMLLGLPPERPLDDTPQPEDGPAEAAGGRGKKRGPRKKYDAKKDARIRSAWETGNFKFYSELAREFCTKASDIEKALDRERRRKNYRINGK